MGAEKRRPNRKFDHFFLRTFIFQNIWYFWEKLYENLDQCTLSKPEEDSESCPEVWIASFALLKDIFSHSPGLFVCPWRICVFGKTAPTLAKRQSDAGDMKERSVAQAEESSRAEKNPDTLLHIKEGASDTIISLGNESPTLLIKTRLLNHLLISPFPLYSFYHSFSAMALITKGKNRGGGCGRTHKAGRSWIDFHIQLLLTPTTGVRLASRAKCVILISNE